MISEAVLYTIAVPIRHLALCSNSASSANNDNDGIMPMRNIFGDDSNVYKQ